MVLYRPVLSTASGKARLFGFAAAYFATLATGTAMLIALLGAK